MLRAFSFDAQGKDAEVDVDSIDFGSRRKHQLIWLVGAPDDTLPAALGAVDGDPAGLLADGAVGWRANEHVSSFVIPNIDRERDGNCTKLRFAFADNWVVTLVEGDDALIEEYLDQDRGESAKGDLTAASLVAGLMVMHFDRLRALAADIDGHIDKLDDAILRSRERHDPLAMMAALRRRAAQLRAKVADHRPVMHAMMRPDVLNPLSDLDRENFRDVERLFERLDDDVLRLRETVIGSFDLYTTRVAQDTNRLVKALTVITVITGCIGMVAGIFGMNFDIPFSGSGDAGFLVVTGAMIVSTAIFVVVALWRKWF